MKSLRMASMALMVALFALGCEGYDSGDQTGSEVQALAGGVSTHMKTEYARAEVYGTGEIEGECRTYEVLPAIYDRTTMEPGGAVERQWIWVRVRMFCCDSDDILTTFTGSALLDDSEFTLDTYQNRNHTWEASVTKSVVVRNTADRSETLTVDLDLDWTGNDDFHHRAENRFLNGDHVSNYELMREISVLSGSVGIPGVTFDFDTQLRVWIGDENRTTIDR